MFQSFNKKNAFLVCMMILCSMMLFSEPAEAKVKAPKKECHAYCVMDAGSGEVLFGQDADKVIYPASTAKLMTNIVCLENGDTSKKIKTQYDVVHGCTPGLYTIGVPSNTKFTFKDLLSISLITSAADATDSLAVGVFGSKKACVEAMNKKVAELGLTHTSFDNPDGSDTGAGFTKTYSTAHEMALICRYAMTKTMIRDAVRKSSYTTSNGVITGNTTNWLIRGYTYYDESKYKVIGSKSGTTNAAGHVFIATAVDKKGHEVICAYFGNVSKESTFASIRSLLNYTFEQYKKGNLTLTKSNYDVRCSKDLAEVYDRYASLNCYPTGNSGLFKPGLAITRQQLAKMMRGVNNLSGNQTLKLFSLGNKKGLVTVARLSKLVNDLYPNHLSKDKVDEALKDCTNIDGLDDEEREALAIMKVHGLFIDDAFLDAQHVLTRKEALLFADALNDYQMMYAAEYPLSVDAEVQNGIMTTVSYVSSTAAQAATETAAATTTEAKVATTTATTAAKTATGTATTAAKSATGTAKTTTGTATTAAKSATGTAKTATGTATTAAKTATGTAKTATGTATTAAKSATGTAKTVTGAATTAAKTATGTAKTVTGTATTAAKAATGTAKTATGTTTTAAKSATGTATTAAKAATTTTEEKATTEKATTEEATTEIPMEPVYHEIQLPAYVAMTVFNEKWMSILESNMSE